MLDPLAAIRDDVRIPLCLSLYEAGNTLTEAPVSTSKRLLELPSTMNNRLFSWPVAAATTDDRLCRFPRTRMDSCTSSPQCRISGGSSRDFGCCFALPLSLVVRSLSRVIGSR